MLFSKKRFLALSLSSAFLLAACGNSAADTESENSGSTAQSETGSATSQEASGEQVTISFWDENAGPQRTPIWEEIIERFEEENPDVNVEYFGLPKDDAKSKFDAAIAANDVPDIASLQTSWLPEYSIREALLPL